MRLDEEILGQETTGPGGTFFALRAIPQALSICHAMEDICPEAWLINYTNPTNFVADAVHRESRIKCIALCDGGGNGLYYFVPDLLGYNVGEVRPRAAGTNHPANWLMELQIKDEDGYPLFKERGHKHLIELKGWERKIAEFSLRVLELYGVCPTNPGYLYPYFNHDDALARYRAGKSVYRMFMADLPELWKSFEAMARGEAPIYMDPEKHHTAVGHGDIAVKIIATIATNKQREFHVNVPNKGSITNLPEGSIVEVPALVDASGVRPLCMGRLPRGVLGLTEAIINWEELTVDAALTGDKGLVLQALLAHPKWPLTIKDAEKLCDEMLKAHAAFLPQFP